MYALLYTVFLCTAAVLNPKITLDNKNVVVLCTLCSVSMAYSTEPVAPAHLFQHSDCLNTHVHALNLALRHTPLYRLSERSHGLNQRICFDTTTHNLAISLSHVPINQSHKIKLTKKQNTKDNQGPDQRVLLQLLSHTLNSDTQLTLLPSRVSSAMPFRHMCIWPVHIPADVSTICNVCIWTTPGDDGRWRTAMYPPLDPPMPL